MKQKEKQVGDGAYEMEEGYASCMPCDVSQINPLVIVGMYGGSKDNRVGLARERAVTCLITMATEHGVWCKATYTGLMAKIGMSHPLDFDEIRAQVEEMISGKKFEVLPKHGGIWGWVIDSFSTQFVYPTPALVSDILEHQRKRVQ